jgi:hypothetical protein
MKHGIDAVIEVMGLIEIKAEPVAQEEFPWTSVVFGAAILWAIVCFTFFGE